MKVQLADENKISRWLIFLLAGACGLIVANLYYAQPLVGPISASTGISSSLSGLIVTMTQLGYAAGLLLLVPLSDVLENRRLILLLLSIAMIGLFVAAFTTGATIFLISAVLIGIGSVAAQILVPLAAYLVSEGERGKIVGNVMSGLLLGIMLARPIASLIAGLWNWQVVFICSAVVMVFLMMVLHWQLPQRKPQNQGNYYMMISSLWDIFKTTPILRRRSLYQAALFGSFSLFWTVVPMWLSDHFHLSQTGIAAFAFLGVAGAVAAPIAGRMADQGWTKKLTGIAIILAALSFVLTHVATGNKVASLVFFCIAAITLDMAVSGNLVLGQQAIYALGDEIRGRVNGLFMAIFFGGGAIGSALGGWAYASGGWVTSSIIGFILPILAFIYYITEKNIK
ncbi:MFS transporter [Paenibacillus turicensis]|uniref:MFS transporter n=1 Tax=Paenibacillus turicensis TaxID=160487 RepID=UPI003D2E57FD